MTSEEFSEWKAYYRAEPFGEERADLRAAKVAFEFARLMFTKRESFQLKDFLPDFGPSEKPRTPIQLKARVREWLSTTKVTNGNRRGKLSARSNRR